MSNWAERAEQERQRQAAEAAAAQRALDTKRQTDAQAAERLRKEQEAQILAKLKLFDELGLERTLREIQRDIWKGKGTLTPKSVSVNEGQGSASSKLELTAHSPEAVYEDVIKQVNGPYTERHQTRATGNAGMSEEYTVQKTGWHPVYVGERLTRVDDDLHAHDWRVGARLSYSLPDDQYVLTIDDKLYRMRTDTNGMMRFPGTNVDRKALSQFADKSFLDYAVNGNKPDLELLARLDQRRARIRANIGKVFEHRPNF